MKITFVTSRSPWPLTRGDSMRLSGFMQALSGTNEVACCAPRMTPETSARLRSWGVEPVAAAVRRWPVAWSFSQPLQVAPTSVWRVPREVVERSDILHVSTLRSAPMVDGADRSRIHLDFVDALSRNTVHRAAASPLGRFWRNEAERLRRYEAELGATVGSASCTTDDDRQAIGIPTIHVIPFGVRAPTSIPAPALHPTILFPGNLGYFANVDAAVWLAEEIFPLVRQTVPDARLLIVGARPTRRIRSLAGAHAVEVHGDVPSMTPYYGAAWVVAAPLRYGTGLQTKVLEAFAHERAVVTTARVASRVPGVAEGVHLDAADDASSLATLIARMLQSRSRRDRFAVAGRTVARGLSWDVCGRMLEAAYQR